MKFDTYTSEYIGKNLSYNVYDKPKICLVSDINTKSNYIKKIKRGGCIYYSFKKGKLKICLGKHQLSGDLTDFGGMKNYDEDIIQCAIREGNEETRNAFGVRKVEDVLLYPILHNVNMCIIFIPIDALGDDDVVELSKSNFNQSKMLDKKCYQEISELVWLNEEEIMDIFSVWPKIKVFDKVRRFIVSYFGLECNIEIIKQTLGDYIYFKSDMNEYMLSKN